MRCALCVVLVLALSVEQNNILGLGGSWTVILKRFVGFKILHTRRTDLTDWKEAC